ncbi:MAG TPA: aminotransferase class I/II-fold pyridoxal phosphate-dependent enzyme [Rummeliibacillus sp.]|nr:aminotransferase class I/II-fold pyridoxal phosphate-dependent enzyme [Rummeliibacillus sp.]
MSLPNHGANPHLLYEQLSIEKPGQIIDFSENVNPAGPPEFIRGNWDDLQHLVARYPDPQGQPFLSAVAKYHGVRVNQVLLGNGAAEIFSLLASMFQKKRAILIHPTFSEYEATLSANDVEIIHLEVEDIATWKLPINQIIKEMQQADVLYLCTPNNPTGVLPPKEQLLLLITEGKKANCHIVLDEAFIDWIDEEATMIPYLEDNPHVMIVRSMTKMYAIAGVRLGYMIASPSIIENLERKTSHWHINGLAAVIGAGCLKENEYRDQAIRFAQKSREEFTAFLQQLGCKTTKSVTNYVSFQLPLPQHSKEFFHAMLKKGFVLRHTENFRGMNGEWFRVGMKKEQAMKALQKEMTSWLKHSSSL